MSESSSADKLQTAEKLVVLCFVLSGMAALMYQTAWMRLFSITFGTSELAVATVLSAYMAGLALGAAIVSRFADRLAKPIRTYALLEAGIAISALLVPMWLWLASKIFAQILGLQPRPPDSGDIAQTAFYLVSTFIIIGIPTAMMGATMPLLARHLVRKNRHIGPRMGMIYGLNTAGAVVGVLLSSFLLLPRVGLNGVVYSAVVVNALIFLIAIRLAAPLPQVELATVVTNASTGRYRFRSGWPGWILPVMLLSGAVSFVYEVLWTRLLGHVIGSSVYAFATMLATFLAGIAIGGSLGGTITRYFRDAATPFAIAQIGTAVFSALTYTILNAWIADLATTGNQVTIAMAIMLPSTLFIGATYPIAVAIIAKNSSEVGSGSARVYAWNTVGAIVGAILAGFVLLPEFGFQGAIRGAVLTNLVLAMAVIVLIRRAQTVLVAASVVTVLLVAITYNPLRPASVIASTAFEFADPPGATEKYYAVGRASTVYLTEANAYFDLRTNGLPEAQIQFRGSLPVRNSQRWLGLMPILARPDARSMLMIGLGGGVALEGMPPTIEDIDVVELEREVLNANRIVGDRRIVDPLADRRVHIVINDARSALGLTDKRYDTIVSQPSHPWTAGSSHLFSQEFLALVKSRLNDDGVLLLWMNSEFLSADLLRSLAATVQSKFSNVRIYKPEAQVMFFLASDGELEIERQLATTGRPLSGAFNHYANNGITGPADIIATLLIDEAALREFAADARPVTDNRNRMAMESQSRGQGLTEVELTDLISDHDPLLDPASWLRGALTDADLVNVAVRLIRTQQVPRARKLAESLPDSDSGRILDALLANANNNSALFRDHLAHALLANPGNDQAGYLLIEEHLDALARGQSDDVTLRIAANVKGTASVVIRGWIFYRNNQWEELRQLDAQLARISTADLWYPRALELRARWRLQVINADESVTREAAEFVEQALGGMQNERLFELRAYVANLLDEDFRYLESVIYVGASIFRRVQQANAGQLQLGEEGREELLRVIDGHISRFDEKFLATTGDRAIWARGELMRVREALAIQR